jgi:hypothetical protein
MKSHFPTQKYISKSQFPFYPFRTLYQALLHSPPPINPGEWKHKGLILRVNLNYTT